VTQKPPAAVLEALDEHQQGVRVEFQKCGDRFSHRLFSVSGADIQPLLESVEGTPEEIAPLSPPFAELHQQQDMLFLTGATTLGHWSMSVQAIEGRLLFDVACRIKAEASHLGSTYQTPVAQTPVAQPLATTSTVESENATITKPTPDTLLIAPSPLTAIDFPTTIQWQYTITKA